MTLTYCSEYYRHRLYQPTGLLIPLQAFLPPEVFRSDTTQREALHVILPAASVRL
jgi:hypothetical protein